MSQKKKISLKIFNQVEKEIQNQIINLKDKNILITGATGFIGQWFLEFLLYLNNKYKLKTKIFVISRKNSKSISTLKKIKQTFKYNFEIIFYDQKNLKKIKIIDYFVHLAYPLNYNNFKKFFFKDSIINLIEIFRLFKFKIKSFFLASTGVINLIYESNNKNNLSDYNYFYGASKKIIEDLSFMYSRKYNFKLVIGRLYSCYGPRMKIKKNNLIPYLLNSIIKKKSAIKINNLENSKRSYCYISDILVYIFRIIFFGKDKKIYNVGNPKSEDIIKTLKKLTTKEKFVIKFKTNKNISIRYLPKLYNELKKKRHINLEEGFLDTLKWYNN